MRSMSMRSPKLSSKPAQAGSSGPWAGPGSIHRIHCWKTWSAILRPTVTYHSKSTTYCRNGAYAWCCTPPATKRKPRRIAPGKPHWDGMCTRTGIALLLSVVGRMRCKSGRIAMEQKYRAGGSIIAGLIMLFPIPPGVRLIRNWRSTGLTYFLEIQMMESWLLIAAASTSTPIAPKATTGRGTLLEAPATLHLPDGGMACSGTICCGLARAVGVRTMSDGIHRN